MAKKKDNSQKNLSKYLTKIKAAENYRDSNYRVLWTRCYKRWRNYVEALTDKDRSNISIPYTFVQVETILPRLVETLFASRPYVTVKSRKADSPVDPKKNETLLDYQQNEVMDFQDLFHIGLKGCAIYGTTVGYVGWKFEQREVIRKEPQPVMDFEIDEEGEPVLDEKGQPIPILGEDGKPLPMLDEAGEPMTELQPVKTTEIEYDDPEVKFIDLGLFYVDPSAEDIDDARYCGHPEFKTKEQLEKLIEQGLYNIDWKKVSKEKNNNKAKEYRMNSVGLPSDKQDSDDNDNLYEVLHYWEDNKHVVIINRSWIAMEGENPFWHKRKPYKKEVYTLVPHEFYGMGIPELVEDLQDELNAERNIRIDFRNFLLRRMFKVRRGSVVDKKTVKWKQGGIIEVEAMDDIQEFGVSDVSSSTFTQESSTKQDMQDATGAHDVVMGTANSKETATSTMTKDNNASMRFKLLISRLEKKLLVGISRLMLQLNQQFLDQERVLRVTGNDGDEWINIAPEEIQGEFDLLAAGSSVEPMANREAYKQRMVELYSMAKSDPLIAQYPDKQRNLLKKVFEAFDIQDVDSILPTDAELQANFQQRVQMEAQNLHQQMMTQPTGGSANTAPMQEMAPMMVGEE